MRTTSRLVLAGACLAGLLAPGALLGAPLATTVRAEGPDATVIPETAVTLDDSGTTQVADTHDADVATVAADSATAQIGSAARQLGVDLWFPAPDPMFGTAVTRIGPLGQEGFGTGPDFWRLSVNHVVSPVGPDSARLAPGDRVTWAYVSFLDTTPELDLAVSSDRVASGAPFDVAVESYDDAGNGVAAKGATVVYAGLTQTTNAAGRATFTAVGEGNQAVTASLPGAVRAPARVVCAVGADPGVCDLPVAPAPAAAAGAGAVSAAGTPAGVAGGFLADTSAPGSRLTFPLAGRRYRTPVRALRGVAGPDRSDIARVEVAFAQRVGTLCRFRVADGRMAAPGPCARQVWVPARSVGGNWYLPLGTRGLRPGLYRAWSRAVDGAGNREGIGIPGVNTLQFRVAATPAP